MKTAKMPVLELAGSPRERGRLHGEALRERIRAVMGAVKEEMGHKGGLAPEGYFDELVEAMPFWPALARWLPGFESEIRGIAEGSNQRFQDIAALNLLDEEVWFGRGRLMGLSAAETVAQHASGKCSVIGVRDDGRGNTLVAQNMDMSTWTEGNQVLLQVKDLASGHQYFAFSVAGMLGSCGMNSAGLGVCCNNVLQLDPAADGMPVAAIVRKMLESASMEEAVDILRGTRHASGQCYTLGVRGRVAAFECSADDVVPYQTWGSGERLVHTNHPLANHHTHVAQREKEAGFEKGLPKFFFQATSNSLARQFALERRCGDLSLPMGVEAIKAVLSSKDDARFPVCRAGDEANRLRNVGYTTGAVVWELGVEPVAHVAAGPPDRTDFVTFRFA